MDLSHFPEFKDDAAFASQMLIEQSVFTLPGMVRETLFFGENYYYHVEFLLPCRPSLPQVVSG